MRFGFTYILSNYTRTVLYTGVTNNIERRIWEHKTRYNPQSFTSKYNVNRLVYCECCESILDAIAWEKKIKGKSRKNNIRLIEKDNPRWLDLSKDWMF